MSFAGDDVVAMVITNDVQDAAGTTASAVYTATLTGGTPCTAVFVAPPSGNVLIHNSSGNTGSGAAAAAYCAFEVRTGATPGGGSQVVAPINRRSVASFGTLTEFMGRASLITGLTPGDTYHARQVFLSTSGTATFESKEIIAEPCP